MNENPTPNRREFIKRSSTAVIGGSMALNFMVRDSAFAANSETLKVGLIGCGGRGSGAAHQALEADPNVVLTAMGDTFESQIQSSLANLKAQVPNRVQVPKENCFVGLDAYQKVINSGVDVVLLASPPGFRPAHLKAAVEAGKHIFCEKPMATDAPGVRSVLESAKIAKEKNLSLVAGFCWRYDLARREFYKRIHEGAIGDVRAIYATYYTGPVKPMPPDSERRPGWSDLEWQVRNWYNFVWLSGDGLVEQAIHSVDKIAWAMKDVMPVKAVAVGGRQIPNNSGNIFDHFEINYEWENGARGFMGCRQQAGCYNQNADFLMGTKGGGNIVSRPEIIGEGGRWRYTGPEKNMYQVEHDELFASIRQNKPINDGIWMSHSTMMGIMGRMAAYTGQEITWDQAFHSKEKLVPDNLSWDMSLTVAPIAMPGKTRLV